MARKNDSSWNNPVQSSEDLGREKLRKDSSGVKYPKPVDISDRVDPSWKRTDGFSAKLDKGPKEDA
jgi:hypothetical protein